MNTSVRSVKLIVTPDVAAQAASLAVKRVRTKPDLVLSPATGGTMEPFYPIFVQSIKDLQIDVSDLRVFGLDEYFGLSRFFSQNSYQYYLQVRLLSPLGICADRFCMPDWRTNYPVLECNLFEKAIRQAGGTDMQLLGLGCNGHIGFNEPGTPLTARTRLINLQPETRVSNSRYFIDEEDIEVLGLERTESGEVEDPTRKRRDWGIEQEAWFNIRVLSRVPGQAMTKGLQTIFEAKEIVMLVTGESKAEAVCAMLMEEPSLDLPASSLRYHDNVTVIINPAAASKLTPDLQQIGIHWVG